MPGNNKGHVIDTRGNGCLKNVEIKREDIPVEYMIMFKIYKVTKRWYKCQKPSSNKEKVADDGDEIIAIHTEIPDDEQKPLVWLRVKSSVSARNDVLWSRPRDEIPQYCEENGLKKMAFSVKKFGVYGSKDVKEDCFFIELGRRKESKPNPEKVGVWISSEYYQKKMFPLVSQINLADCEPNSQIFQQVMQNDAQMNNPSIAAAATAATTQPMQMCPPNPLAYGLPWNYFPQGYVYPIPDFTASQQNGIPMNTNIPMNIPMQQPMMDMMNWCINGMNGMNTMGGMAQENQPLHDDGSFDENDLAKSFESNLDGDGNEAYTLNSSFKL